MTLSDDEWWPDSVAGWLLRFVEGVLALGLLARAGTHLMLWALFDGWRRDEAPDVAVSWGLTPGVAVQEPPLPRHERVAVRLLTGIVGVVWFATMAPGLAAWSPGAELVATLNVAVFAGDGVYGPCYEVITMVRADTDEGGIGSELSASGGND
jgi:hypothetical protein